MKLVRMQYEREGGENERKMREIHEGCRDEREKGEEENSQKDR